MTQDDAEDKADDVVRAIADLIERTVDMKLGKVAYFATDQSERTALKDAVLVAMGMQPTAPRGSRG